MRILFLAVTLLFAAQAAPIPNWQDSGVILKGESARALLRLCYRPELKVSGQWTPSGQQITQLETKLKAQFSALEFFPVKPKGPLERLSRQYAGFVAGGRKIIFVSFFPKDVGMDWRSQAVVICDGGPSVWSVEFEVNIAKFVNAAVSGRY
jgi:hypothetical protein